MASDVGKFHFRLVLLGANETGKTSILNRFLSKKYEPKYKPTVEDLFSKEFDLGNIEIKVDFLDTSGSMQFPAMRRLSISTANAFLIVYSVNDMNSFEAAKLAVSEIREIRPDFQEIPIVFAGNKCDLDKSDRLVSKEFVTNYVYYELPRLRTRVIECSCKENVNIDNIFRAYLSLAKISLSSAVSANLHKKLGSNAPGLNDNSQLHTGNDENSNTNSKSLIKTALGVRKSCDASIVITSKMRNMSLTSTPAKTTTDNTERSAQNSPLATMIEGKMTSGVDTSEPETKQQSSDEVFITDALQQSNRLSVDQGHVKPRSRSLIWRPSRRKSRNSNGADHETSGDCRVT